MYIEYSSGDKYEKIVLSQQGYSNEIIPFQRGDIVDRKGSVLATSVDVYNLYTDRLYHLFLLQIYLIYFFQLNDIVSLMDLQNFQF